MNLAITAASSVSRQRTSHSAGWGKGKVMTATQTMLAPSTAVRRSTRSETSVICGETQGISTSQVMKMMASFWWGFCGLRACVDGEEEGG